MCQGVNTEYILCCVLIYDPVNENTSDLGHYSTMNMNFNKGSWTGIDDDTVRRISSFTLMNEIHNFVDKENLSSMVYCRENVCAVTYIKKEYLCCQIREKLMDTSLIKSVPYDDNQEDIESNWNSIHDTDTSNSDDGDDKKTSCVAIVPQNLQGNLNIKQLSLKNDGL